MFQLGDDEFGPVVKDNLALIDQAETENFEENKLEAEPEPTATEMSMLLASMTVQDRDPVEQLSQSKYFLMSTSRLGNLEDGNTTGIRPDLGFPRIASPKKIEPVKLVTEPNVISKSNDPMSKLLAVQDGINQDPDREDRIRKNTYMISKSDKPVNDTIELPSFLEVTRQDNTSRIIRRPQQVARHSSPVKAPAKIKSSSTDDNGNHKFAVPALPPPSASAEAKRKIGINPVGGIGFPIMASETSVDFGRIGCLDNKFTRVVHLQNSHRLTYKCSLTLKTGENVSSII